MDLKVRAIAEYIESIMKILGIPITESNVDTPKRIAKMWVNEFFKNCNNQNIEELNDTMKVFRNVDSINNMVIVSDIDFHSVCEHHWLPFSGKVNVGYVPDKYIVGLSKIPRVVDYFSRKPQLQERLVKEIGEYLFEKIKPKYLIVEAKAVHDCVMCRGIESKCTTHTMYTNWNEEVKQTGDDALYFREFFMRSGRSGS